MILRHKHDVSRAGLSLLEVLVALSIFLICFAILSQLMSLASERASDVELRTRSAQLCQSKMNEVTSGIIPLQGQGNTPFDEDGDWQWSLDANQATDGTGLWTLTVHVSRTSTEGPQANTELWGMLLDPGQRGSALDTVTVTSSATSSTSSSDSSSSSTDPSTGSTGSSSTPAASGTPAATGAASSGATKMGGTTGGGSMNGGTTGGSMNGGTSGGTSGAGKTGGTTGGTMGGSGTGSSTTGGSKP